MHFWLWGTSTCAGIKLANKRKLTWEKMTIFYMVFQWAIKDICMFRAKVYMGLAVGELKVDLENEFIGLQFGSDKQLRKVVRCLLEQEEHFKQLVKSTTFMM
jgi:hypothetical protein